MSHLKEPREHVGWLAPDDEKARVELAKAGVQILQTLEKKPEERQEDRNGTHEKAKIIDPRLGREPRDSQHLPPSPAGPRSWKCPLRVIHYENTSVIITAHRKMLDPTGETRAFKTRPR